MSVVVPDPFGSTLAISQTTDEQLLELLNGEKIGLRLVQQSLTDAGIEPEALFGYHVEGPERDVFRARLSRVKLTENAIRMFDFIRAVSLSGIQNWYVGLRQAHPDNKEGSHLTILIRIWIAGRELPASLMQQPVFNDAAANRLVPTRTKS